MGRQNVTGGKVMRAVALGCVIGAVAGCEEGQEMAFLQSKEQPAEVSSRKAQSTKLIERDIESPEVFQATESGLWDGRPSLGGVWVAHPDVSEPQRVIIRNSANDKFVIGALFRRERDIPGPRIQASSDAASALGMLAGAPVQLNITALVREEVPNGSVAEETDPAEAMPTVIADGAEPTDTPADTGTTAQDATPTVIAEDTAPAKKPGLFGGLFGKNKAPAEETNAIPTVVADSSGTSDDPTIVGAAAAIEASALPPSDSGAGTQSATPTVVAEETETPKKPALFAGLFGKKKGEPAETGATPTVIEHTAATASDTEIEVRPTVVASSGNSGSTARPGFLAGIFANGNRNNATANSAGTSQQVAAASTSVTGAPLSAIPAAATPTVVAAPLPKSSALKKPYIQIGIFSVEENANRTADQMRRAGMVPTIFEQSASGKAFWRVVVGPAQSKTEANTLLKKVNETGFSDAYFVTN